jgi:hypothetical protein
MSVANERSSEDVMRKKIDVIFQSFGERGDTFIDYALRVGEFFGELFFADVQCKLVYTIPDLFSVGNEFVSTSGKRWIILSECSDSVWMCCESKTRKFLKSVVWRMKRYE